MKKNEWDVKHKWERWQICDEFFREKPENKRPLDRPRHEKKDQIKVDLKKKEGAMQILFMWLWIRSNGGLFEQVNEDSVFIKCMEFVY